jgi:hypothetical protein
VKKDSVTEETVEKQDTIVEEVTTTIDPSVIERLDALEAENKRLKQEKISPMIKAKQRYE